ncbi:hypothetical protein ACFV9W_31870 [Streptomyces sp. NPDC059897]|uniref:hypothetical protein n=1 Tax=Streptomyces sp. NPDC059897 TaxID=3346994 RepID=UPI00366101C7
MLDIVLLAVVAIGVAGLIALPFFFHHVHIGSTAARERRRQEILRTLDGRPEVKVLASGTGWSMDQTLWMAHQYGYELARVEGFRAQPRYLVLRSTRAPFPPFPPPPGAFPPPPGSPELASAAQRVKSAGNPGAIKILALVLAVPGAGTVAKALITAAQNGEVSAARTAIGVVLFAAGATLYVVGRRTARRSAPRSHW